MKSRQRERRRHTRDVQVALRRPRAAERAVAKRELLERGAHHERVAGAFPHELQHRGRHVERDEWVAEDLGMEAGPAPEIGAQHAGFDPGREHPSLVDPLGATARLPCTRRRLVDPCGLLVHRRIIAEMSRYRVIRPDRAGESTR